MSGRRWMRLRVKAEIWRRVAAGEPTREIAAAIGYSVRTVEEVIWRAGGIAPRAFRGAPRPRSPLRLRPSEREEISRGLGAGPVSYTHLRAHETGRNLVCRLLLEKKK